MSLPTNKTDGYVLYPDEGEAYGPFVGFGSPIHVHSMTTNSS
jgi:hypothetical protein